MKKDFNLRIITVGIFKYIIIIIYENILLKIYNIGKKIKIIIYNFINYLKINYYLKSVIASIITLIVILIINLIPEMNMILGLIFFPIIVASGYIPILLGFNQYSLLFYIVSFINCLLIFSIISYIANKFKYKKIVFFSILILIYIVLGFSILTSINLS